MRVYSGRSAAAAFGLVVGAERTASLVCGLRRDGAVVLHHGSRSDVLAWRPGGDASPTAGGLDLLEVRVTATLATCLVNGRAIGSVPATPGAFDGTPGVYIGPGTSVPVRRFTVDSAVLQP